MQDNLSHASSMSGSNQRWDFKSLYKQAFNSETDDQISCLSCPLGLHLILGSYHIAECNSSHEWMKHTQMLKKLTSSRIQLPELSENY